MHNSKASTHCIKDRRVSVFKCKYVFFTRVVFICGLARSYRMCVWIIFVGVRIIHSFCRGIVTVSSSCQAALQSPVVFSFSSVSFIFFTAVYFIFTQSRLVVVVENFGIAFANNKPSLKQTVQRVGLKCLLKELKLLLLFVALCVINKCTDCVCLTITYCKFAICASLHLTDDHRLLLKV